MFSVGIVEKNFRLCIGMLSSRLSSSEVMKLVGLNFGFLWVESLLRLCYVLYWYRCNVGWVESSLCGKLFEVSW